MPPKEELETQVLERECKGLYLSPNPYVLPEGALLEAQNVVIDRPNIISKSRGLNRYGNILSNAPSAMSEFNDKVLVLDGTTLKYDSDGAGTWTSLSGTFSAPDANNKMRFAESLFSLFFTTSTGIFRLDTLSGTPARSGIPQGLDIEPSFIGTGLGFFNTEAQIGYKVVYVRKDGNNQELIGAPSFRVVVKNPVTATTWTRATTTLTVTHTSHGYTTGDTVIVTNSSDSNTESVLSTITVSDANTYTYTVADTGAASGTQDVRRDENVQIITTIPDEIAAGDFLEVYRTEMSADINTDPGGRYLKVTRIELAAGDITAGTYTFSDDFPEAFLGEELYDNQTAEGSDQSNYRAPYGTDVVYWNGHLWTCNTRQPHRLRLDMKTTEDMANDDTVTIGGRTYTAKAAEDTANQQFLLDQSQATEAQNVENTSRSLVRTANRDSGNSTFYLHYVSGPNDPPGQLLIERRDLTDTALAVTANASDIGGDFEPVLPTSGSTVATEATQQTNRVFHSKAEQPDAWPLLNYDDIGPSRSKVLRLVPLRDSLMVFTERGVYRIHGPTEIDFTIDLIETDIQLLAPESPAVLSDSVWCFSNQGVVSLNENGARVRSFYGIDKELQKLQTFSNYKTLTWGIAYDEDHKYILWAQDESGDSTVTVGWIWNDFTETWTRRLKKVSCGVVPQESQVMYLGHAVDTYVLKERKSFTANATDFIDESIAITITGVSTGTHPTSGATVSELTFTYTYTGVTLTTEFGISQNTDFGRILVLTDNGASSYTATLDTLGANWATGAATADIPIVSRVKWAPEVFNDPSKRKQFSYFSMSLEADTARSMTLKFHADTQNVEVAVNPIVVAITAGWGSSPWGSSPWGNRSRSRRSTPFRVPIPRRCQKCRALSPIFEHSRARSYFDICNTSLTVRNISSRTDFAP